MSGYYSDEEGADQAPCVEEQIANQHSDDLEK